MQDGSDAIADWPILNALLNTASGASWVSVHHGGGVGIGNSIHAGLVVVADGTPRRTSGSSGCSPTTRASACAARRRGLRGRDRDRACHGRADPDGGVTNGGAEDGDPDRCHRRLGAGRARPLPGAGLETCRDHPRRGRAAGRGAGRRGRSDRSRFGAAGGGHGDGAVRPRGRPGLRRRRLRDGRSLHEAPVDVRRHSSPSTWTRPSRSAARRSGRCWMRAPARSSSSAPAPRCGRSRAAAYIVSKAAVIALMQTIDAEVRGKGVRANVVVPNIVDTPRNRAEPRRRPVPVDDRRRAGRGDRVALRRPVGAAVGRYDPRLWPRLAPAPPS